jgi:DNA polymerase-2
VPEVHLYGVLESGEPCLIIDDRVRPYFFIRAADRTAAETRHRAAPRRNRSADLRRRSRAARQRRSSGEVPALRGRLSAGVACFEADIRFAYRYLIDRGIRGAFDVHGGGERHERLGMVLRNPTLEPALWTPTLKTLSIDIETDPRAEHIYSIALHTPEFSRVLIVHQPGLTHAEPVHSERELIQRFLAYLEELNPDIITGWNVVDFDLAVLARQARRYGMTLPIGRTPDHFDLRREQSYTRESRAITYGRLVLDALSLARGAFIRLQDYRLETAAQALLGHGKLIAGDNRHLEIERLYRTDTQRFVDYNLQDARLVTEILERTGLIELAVERSLLTGMPLDRVSAAIASVDSLYLGALQQRRRVAPSVGRTPAAAPLLGGYVMDSLPGLYRNVLVFDFKSLYPSIIRTFNLDPLSLLPDGDSGDDALVAPNGALLQPLPARHPAGAGRASGRGARARQETRPVDQVERHQDP